MGAHRLRQSLVFGCDLYIVMLIDKMLWPCSKKKALRRGSQRFSKQFHYSEQLGYRHRIF